MKRVMICTPSIDGMVATGYATSYAYTILEAKERGWKVSSQMLVFNSNIAHARALICHEFMKSNADVMFSIDADLSWSVEGFFKVLDAAPDLVFGCYPRKQDELDFTTFGGGFYKVTRAGIERMREAYPELCASYIQDGIKKDNLFMLWNEMIDDGMIIGEDISFFRRWKKIGGEIAVETDIDFEHYGTKTYRGNMADHLKQKENGNGFVLRDERLSSIAYEN